MTTALFYVFGALSIASALLAVSRKNPVASAIWLVVMFFALAGIYVVLEAFFVAAVQVMVYAGAIMVLFLFVIMLLDLRTETLALSSAPTLKGVGAGAAVLFLAGVGMAVWNASEAGLFSGEVQDLDAGAGAIGNELFTVYLLSFEVTSVLLLGAILGAVILTKRRLT